MNRRDFIKIALTGAATLLVSGCAKTLATPSASTAAASSTVGSTAAGAAQQGLKIAVLTGSPHRNGTSALLAERFIAGASEAGHSITRFNSAFEQVHPCMACGQCKAGSCQFTDAFTGLVPALTGADLIVLITPLYYYDMSAQLKTVLDRCTALKEQLRGKQVMLMSTAYNSADWTFTSLVDHYQGLCDYMNWRDVGMVLGYGCGYRSAIEGSQYPDQAYRLGRELKLNG